MSWCRIDNTAANLAAEIVAAGEGAEVAMEATWGWYWAADVIAECGANLHLAHPLGIAAYENRRVRNDLGDAYVDRIESLRDLIELYDREIGQCDPRIYPLKGHPGYEAIPARRGVGPVLAAVFVAEIGDGTSPPTRRDLGHGHDAARERHDPPAGVVGSND